ncbi:MAG: CHAD domain-containing protein [Myxococcales bacterium]|nr:CHAD domain-containing protein [Myxococcales bacterium]
MSDPTSALLDLPVGLAARRVARSFLDEARAAAARLDDPDDSESLHDFRVAIRRLRATLRAWRKPLLPEITRRDRDALRRVQQATGDGRDAEVMLAWVRAQADAMPAAGLPGQRRLAERLAARKDDAYARARGDVRGRFAEVDEGLRARLSTMTRVVDVDRPQDPPRYADALAAAITAQVRALDERIRHAVATEHAEELHAARIDAKRLRYLVEPVHAAVGGVDALLKRCKGLQDVLGEFQDAAVLATELRGAAKGEDEAAGIATLAALNRARADRLFAEVAERWVGGGLAALVEAVDGVAAGLRGGERGGEGGAEEGVEIERKYLLSGLPPAAEAAGPPAELDQGYLPGERLIERIRRVRTAAGERFVRTVKTGKGVRRVELEEDCDAATYAALWPLTEGRRVQKVRYAVPDGDRVWEIDAFTDRALWLAEIELPHEDAAVVFPDWLAAYVVRDVTDEGEYTNRRLSK